MKVRGLLLLLATVFLAGVVSASVFLTGTTEGCTYMKPGQTKMFILSVKEPEAGNYIVTLTSDGLVTYPQELDLYLEANKTAQRWVKIVAPLSVLDEYYTLEVAVYKADTGSLVESKQYCFHVYKGILASKMPDIAFGYKNVETRDGYVYITLFITNLGQLPATVELDSDYGRVEFEMNPVVVKGYRTVEVIAKVPVDEYLPEYVTFLAKIDNAQKEITVKMPVPEAVKPKVSLEVPEEIVVDGPVKEFTVKLTNEGGSPLTIVISGKQLPLGISILSDEYQVEPGETVLAKAYIVPKGVTKTGTYLVKLCIKDVYGAELSCKLSKMVVKSKGEVNVKEQVSEEGYTVTISVENGAKKYYGVSVEVDLPEGWKYVARPKMFDLAPYEEKDVTVTFKPEENAKEGTAVIRLVAPDGTVLAQKVVKLSPTALTGYATAGSSTVLGWIIAAIVIALIVAMILKRGKEIEEDELEEFEELKSRE